MKKICMKAAGFAAAFAIAAAAFFPKASALADNGFTHLLTTNNPYCYADIVIEGDHFTVNGRSVIDPVVAVRFSSGEAELRSYEFTTEGYSFHAEFDAVFSGDRSDFWLVHESRLVSSYIIQHDEKGWSFPDNGLAAMNSEKLENIQTAAPEASAYYISQTADPVETEETLAELERIVQEVCGDAQDDYEKAYLLYRWISENFYYDKDAAAVGVTLDTVAIHNVLERRRTTCAGFANTYCALLEIAGIRSVNLKGAAVSGDVTYGTLLTGGENHEFTAFWYEAEGRWAYVDPTWGRSGIYENGEYSREYPSNDKYFDETGESFALKHRIDRAEERDYTGALEALNVGTEDDGGEGTDSTDTGGGSSQSGEDSEAQTSHTTKTPSQNNETAHSGNFVIYIVIGAVGVAVVVIGVSLAIKNRGKM